MADKSKSQESAEELPMSVVARVTKAALPDNIQVSKDAKVAIAKAAKVFLVFLTSSAHSYSREANRSTINVVDVESAIEQQEFNGIFDSLKDFLNAYREEHNQKKQTKGKSKAKAEGDAEGDAEEEDGEGEEAEGDAEDEE